MLLQAIQESAEYVCLNASPIFLETHYSRALALELSARGITQVHLEAQCPTLFETSDGKRHVMCNDRADILLQHNQETMVIEVKRGLTSEMRIRNAKYQALRYKHNLETRGSLTPVSACVVFFDPNGCSVSIYSVGSEETDL